MHLIGTILISNKAIRCKHGHILRHRNQREDEQIIYEQLVGLTLAKQVKVYVLQRFSH